MLLHCMHKVIGRIVSENALPVAVRQRSGPYNNATLFWQSGFNLGCRFAIASQGIFRISCHNPSQQTYYLNSVTF